MKTAEGGKVFDVVIVGSVGVNPNHQLVDNKEVPEIADEEDGRWIAEALELPGVMFYGKTREEAINNAERLAN